MRTIHPTFVTAAFSFALICLLSVSCNNNTKSADSSKASETIVIKDTIAPLPLEELHLSDKDFGEIVELTGVSHPVEEIFRISETEMIIKDSLLIMKNRPFDKGFFMIYSLPDFRFLASVGNLGNGPLEFQFPHLIKSSSDSVLCYIYEGTKAKMYSMSNDFTINELDYNITEDGSGWSQKDFCSINDSTFLYADNAKGGKAISTMKISGDSLTISRDYPIAFSEKHKNWAAYTGCLGVNSDYDRAVYVYKYFRRLRFYDLENKTFRDVIFGADEKKSETDVETLAPTNITYYWKISPQKKHIYCLYSGRTPVQVHNELKKEISYIYVEQFDWNGNPVRKYRLDHWGYFCVNEQEDTIYLVSTDEEQPFYSYQLFNRK